MTWTNDPVADAERYAAEQERQAANLPRCDFCNEPMTEDFYEINGENICEVCLDRFFKKDIGDYVS